jgi:hypothetical protein
VHQARQQDGHHAAAVAEGDFQLRVPGGDAAGDHRGAGKADVAGKHTACSMKPVPTMRSCPAGRSACTKIAALIDSAAAKNGSKRGSPIEMPFTWLANLARPEN